MGKRVLVVDDSPMQARGLRMILEEGGYEVAVAHRAKDALEVVRSDTGIGLVLSDVVMPGPDGLWLCRSVKEELGPEGAPPVLLVTTLDDPADLVRGLASGADGYLTKPVQPQRLLERVGDFLSDRPVRSRRPASEAVMLRAFGRMPSVEADREQVLDLLLASFEEFASTYEALQHTERERARALEQERKARAEAEAARREKEALLQELERKQALLDAVLAQMPAGVAMIEAPEGRLLYHNEEAVRLLGHPLMDAGGEGDRAPGALHEDGTPYAPEEYPTPRALLRGEVVRDEEVRYRRGEGDVVHLSINSGPVRDPAGKVVAAVSVFEDISERKQAEEERARLLALEQEARERAEEAVQVRDDVLRMVSHDLRNPISAILTIAELLEEFELDRERQAKQVQAIRRTAEQMSRLVSGLLDLKRIEAGQAIPVDPKPVEVRPLLVEGSVLFALQAEQKGVEVVHRAPEGLPAVQADRERVLQVLWNLTGNAIKFTPEHGRVVVEAGAHGDDVLFSVTDTGAGIPPEDQEKLFDPFWQAKRTARLGTGLGLPISKAIVEAHGGRIWVESAVGEGTTFRFTLPAASESRS